MAEPSTPSPESLLQHAAFVRGVATAALRGDPSLVDDVVQETWVAALESRGLRGAKLRAWLGGVARRQAANLLRRRSATRRRETRAARPEAAQDGTEVVERAEVGRRLVRAVMALEEPYRTAVLLRYYDDLPPRDIAARTGVPVETARTRVKRGLKQLRQRLDEDAQGRRQVWQAALLPLVGPQVPTVASTGPAVATGGLLAVKKLALSVGALLFVAGTVALVAPSALRLAFGPQSPEIPEVDSVESVMPGSSPREPRLAGGRQPARGEVAADPRSRVKPRAGTIRGRVIDVGGEAVDELTVYLLTGRRYAECDGQGHFELPGVPAGRHRIEALEAVSSPVGDGVEVSLAAGQALEDVEIVVPRPLVLGGVVVDGSDRPVSHLPLRFTVRTAHGLHGWMLRRPVHTDDQGRFLTRVWREGKYSARGPKAALRGSATTGREDAHLVYDPGVGPSVAVRVVDHAGVPVPRATLTAHLGNSPHAFTGTDIAVVDGLAHVPRQEDSPYVILEVSNPQDSGGRPLPLSGATGNLDWGQKELILVLEAAQRTAGRVVDECGSPVSGVGVHAVSSSWPVMVKNRLWARSSATGAFAIEGCPPGMLQLRAIPDSTHDWIAGPALEAEAGRDDLVITLQRSVSLDVIVLDPGGSPVPGATVRAVQIALPARQARGKTDAEGRAVLHRLPPSSSLDVHVVTDGSDSVFPSVLRRRVSAPGELVISLPRPVEIRGVVVDETGRPRGEAEVIGQSLGQAGSAEIVKSEPVTGEFVLRRMRRGIARVWLGWGPDNRPPTEFQTVDAPAKGVRLVIPSSIAVEGRLLVENPLEWSVEWVLPNGSAMATVEEDGRFRIGHARGPVGSILARPNANPFLLLHQEERGERVALLENVHPEDGPFVLVPEEGMRVKGVVRGCPPRSSRPLNLRILLRRDSVTLVGYPDEEGSFEVDGVPPGEWDLELWDSESLDRINGIQAGRTDVVLNYPERGD